MAAKRRLLIGPQICSSSAARIGPDPEGPCADRAPPDRARCARSPAAASGAAAASSASGVSPSCRSRSSRVGSSAPGALPPPMADMPSTTSARQPAERQRRRQRVGARAGSRRAVSRQHPLHRHVVRGAAGRVLLERGFERRVGQLVDAQRAHQRMAADRDRPASRRPDDDAGLRAAEQLVAAEADDVDARPRSLACDRRLVAQGSADPRVPIRARDVAAAEILGDRHA